MASIVKKNRKGRIYYYVATTTFERGETKRKWVYAGRDERDAQILLAKIELGRLTGEDVEIDGTARNTIARAAKTTFSSLYTLLDRFLSETDIASATRTRYDLSIRTFKEFLGSDRALKFVSVGLLEEFKASRSHLAFDTVRNDIVALKAFYSWMNRLEIWPENPVKKVKLRRPEKNKPKPFLTQTQIDQLLALASENPRDHALFSFMLNTGCRLGEVTGMAWEHIDLEAGRITVMGKGSKYRTIPLTPEALKALESVPHRDGAVWLNKWGRPMNRAAIRMIFRRYDEKLDFHLHPHLLRHTFATHLMASCGNPVIVKEILGHSNIQTTMIYAHVNDSMMAEAVSGLYRSATQPRQER